MDIGPEDMKRRTRPAGRRALRIVRLVEALPKGRTADAIARQLIRSGTSVGANYRSACRAKSTADFVSKMGHAEEEADETLFWLELLCDSDLVKATKPAALMKEADELVSIAVSSIKTARKGKRKC